MPQPTVLIVDDDPAMVRITRKWLEAAGYDVADADNGQAALALIESRCPHFLVTDWEMPVMDGLELCRQVRLLKLPHYVYSLIVTARAAPDDMVRGLENGADDFVRKPVDKDELLARLRAGSRVLDMESRLQHLANSDALTGLYTKRVFNEHFERELCRARRYGIDLSCVIMDIDFFKRINDTHGHPAGDEVIRTVCQLLRDNCRGSDIVGRFGGEEFCALLPETNEADALIWAERLREIIKATPIQIEGTTLHVTCSFGIAESNDDALSAGALLEQADQCLLAAKQTGRDKVVRYQCVRQLSELYGDPNSNYGAVFRDVCAKHIMTTIVAGLQLDSTIGSATEYFLQFRISSAPVVDERGKLVGFVSEKDVMNVLFWPDCWSRPIRDVMKSNVICYEEDTPALAIYEFLCRVSIRSIVVVRDGVPSGVINRGSLLRWFGNAVAHARAEHPVGDRDQNRARMQQAVNALAEIAGSLQTAVREQTPAEALPQIIGGASRIQDLVTDLLADARHSSDCIADAHVAEGGQATGFASVLPALGNGALSASPSSDDPLVAAAPGGHGPGTRGTA